MTPKNPLWQMLEKLKAAFPEAVTETTRKDKSGKPVSDYAVTPEFIQLLQKEGMDFTGDNGRYELQFPGKQMARASALVPCNKTLLPDEKQSKNFRNTGNVFIEGDNLNALKMLQRSYRDRIKVIYIDPPYNTGDDGFVYNDDFSVSQTAYLRAAGVVDDDGVRQISEVQNKLRGRFHAGWLAFMYPRLKLARELLADDGAIFISIDDNEQANLKLLCDEIFGEQGEFAIWRKSDDGRYGKMKNTKTIRNDHEYVLIAFKDKNIAAFNKIKTLPNFSSPTRKDKKGEWWQGYIARGENGSNPNHSRFYTVTAPNGKEFSAQFEVDKDEFDKLDAAGYIHWADSGVPYRKMYTHEKRPIVASSVFLDVGTSYSGKCDLEAVMGTHTVFSNPKPIDLVKRVVELGTLNGEGIVLDFFAGSATTAHAVMQLNAEDNGARKFILVQLPEKINEKTSKDAHEFCKALKRPATIAEIAKERIRRAGEKIRKDNLDWQGDDGFKVFTIEDSLLRGSASDDAPVAKAKQTETLNFKINLKPANFDAVLYETLLHTGAMLDQPLTTGKAGKYPFAICNRNCYCVTEKLTQDIAREIVEKHGDEFDMLYYLSDALESTTSYTQIESALNLANKQAQMLAFY